MQVSVQKFTRTTRPRSSPGASGAEPSHEVAPPSEGICAWSGTVPSALVAADRPVRAARRDVRPSLAARQEAGPRSPSPDPPAHVIGCGMATVTFLGPDTDAYVA